MAGTKRIVLTGASGFVGQHVLRRLMEEPVEIYALYWKGNGFANATFPKNAHVESLDLTDEKAVQAWVSSHSELDLCLHLAAMANPRDCEENPDQAFACNNPQHWFRALSSRNVPIVALSTDQVYDGKIQDARYKETDPTNPVNVYGTSKVAMEDSLSKHEATCVILRSSIVLGPLAPFGQAHSTFLHFCASRKGQETDFYTDEFRTVVPTANVADALLYFCRNGVAASGVYNMGSSDRVSRYDMAKAVFDYFGYDDRYLIAKQKAFLPAAAVASPLDISMDSSKLEQLTGIRMKGLDDILKDTFPKDVS